MSDSIATKAADAIEDRWYGSSAFLLFSRSPCNPTPESEAVAAGSSCSSSCDIDSSCNSRFEIKDSSGGNLPANSTSSSFCSWKRDAVRAQDNLAPTFDSAYICKGGAVPPAIDRLPWEELPPEAPAIKTASAAFIALWLEVQNSCKESKTPSSSDSSNSSNITTSSSSSSTNHINNDSSSSSRNSAITARVARSIFDKFFSESTQERLIGAAGIEFLAAGLGENRRELLSFLLTHLENEEDRLVLEVIARQLVLLLHEEAQKEKKKEGQFLAAPPQSLAVNPSNVAQCLQAKKAAAVAAARAAATENGAATTKEGEKPEYNASKLVGAAGVALNGATDAVDTTAALEPTSSEGRGESEGSLFFQLLLQLLLQQDRLIREIALSGLYLFLGIRAYVSVSTFQCILIPQLLQLLQDESFRYQTAAALLLPMTALHFHHRLCEKISPQQIQRRQQKQQRQPQLQVQQGQQWMEAPLQNTGTEALENQLKTIVEAYVVLCRDTAIVHVQQQAGTQLALFVHFCAAALEQPAIVPTTQSYPQLPINIGTSKGSTVNTENRNKREEAPTAELATRTGSDGAISVKTKNSNNSINDRDEKLLQNLSEVLASFTNSPSETLRMQGVQCLAAMADRSPLLFRNLGKEFLPLLCTDVSWRVRAAVCERLERLATFFTTSVTSTTTNTTSSNSSSNVLSGIAVGPGTCLASLLTQLLKDREVNVKCAALRKIRLITQTTGNCSGVVQAFLEEGEALCNTLGTAAAAGPSPIFSEFLETLCVLMRVANTNETRWQLTIFLFTLLSVDDWHLIVTFLKNLELFLVSPLPCFYSVVTARLHALTNPRRGQWRTRAAVLQQLPLLLLQPDLEANIAEQLWQLLRRLLMDDVWAVRQEGGTALIRLTTQAHLVQLPEPPETTAESASSNTEIMNRALEAASTLAAAPTIPSLPKDWKKRDVVKSGSSSVIAQDAEARDKFLRQRLLPLLVELKSSNFCALRGECCRYVVSLQPLFTEDIWTLHLRPLLEDLLVDSAPQTRYAAAKAVHLLEEQLHGQQAPSSSFSEKTASWLSAVKAQILADEDCDVADIFKQ